jgi:hypothetical protein
VKPVFVEVLDRRGHTVSRVRLTQLPASVGRGYENVVMLDDPYVAAKQFEIHQDATTGEVSLRAGNAENPTRFETTAGGEPAQILTTGVQQLLVRPQTRVQVGKTMLRIVVGHPDIAPTRPLEGVNVPWHRFAGLALAGLIGIAAFKAWFDMIDEVKWTELFASVLAVVGLAFVWSGAWAFITRLLQGVSRFSSHLAIAALCAVVASALGWLIDLASFSLNLPTLNRAAPFLIGLVGAAGLLAHLQVANGQLSARVTAAVAAGLAAVGLFGLVSGYQTHKTFLPGRFLTTVLPPSWRLSGESSLEHLVERVSNKREAIEALQKMGSDDDGFLE